MRRLSLESAAGAGEETNQRTFHQSAILCALASLRAGGMEHVVLPFAPRISKDNIFRARWLR